MNKVHTNNKRFSDDSEYTELSDSYLGYSEKHSVQSIVTIPIDNDFKDASYYRHIANRIVNTQEGDIVEFEIHSGGGQYKGLTAILSSLLRTSAHSIAYINGECHSCASMLALSCNEVQISPFAEMLVHFQSFSPGFGKSSDIIASAEHAHNNGAGVFRDIYEFFLTETEIESCIDGKELWMNADEIIRRLEVREEMRELVMQEMSEGDIEELLTEDEADGTVDDTEDEAVVALGEAFDVAADEFGKTKLANSLANSLVEKKASRKK
jgi:ATP-dependent protease ClpP protease subunit